MPTMTTPSFFMGEDIERNAQAYVGLATFSESRDLPETYAKAHELAINEHRVPHLLGDTVDLNGELSRLGRDSGDGLSTKEVKRLFYQDANVGFSSMLVSDEQAGTSVLALGAILKVSNSRFVRKKSLRIGAVFDVFDPKRSVIVGREAVFRPYVYSAEYRKKLLAENAPDLSLHRTGVQPTTIGEYCKELRDTEPTRMRIFIETLRDLAGVAVVVHRAIHEWKREQRAQTERQNILPMYINPVRERPLPVATTTKKDIFDI